MKPQKIRLNIYYVDYLLSPLVGAGDDDEAYEKYRGVTVETEEQFRAVIRDELKPFFYDFMNETNKVKVKLALSYALSKKDTNFRGILFSSLLPFKVPENSRQFFVCIWEEFFEGKDYDISDLEAYEEVFDIKEPHKFDFE